MTLLQNNYTIGTTSVQVDPPSNVVNSFTAIIQNNHASNIVYVGNSSAVTSSSFGVQLAAGSSVSLDDLRPTDQIWVIASAASTPVSAFTIQR